VKSCRVLFEIDRSEGVLVCYSGSCPSFCLSACNERSSCVPLSSAWSLMPVLHSSKFPGATHGKKRKHQAVITEKRGV
jgi:hypothetical protein